MTSLKPDECKSKEEVRNQIDLIDLEILRLFALRFQYVKEIVKFKNDIQSVVAQDRKDSVIASRAKIAGELGLDKKTFEQIFTILIDSNIQKEIDMLKQA